MRNETDLNVRDFNTTRKKKQEIILNLQMNIENHKIVLPKGNEESKRMTDLIVDELSMFSILDNGRFAGVGAHDDLVMGLALANSATHTLNESFVLLDDIDIFDSPVTTQVGQMGGGVFGLNI